MKKILSVGILALVALAAAVFTSCSKDDDEKSDSFTFRCAISCLVSSDKIFDAVTSAYQNLLGSDATVERTAETYVFNIKCSEDNKEAVLNKIKDATMSDLTKEMDKLHVASYLSVSMYYGNTLSSYLTTYEYQMAISSFLPGTYSAKADDGTAIKIVISDPKDNKYSATVTVGGTAYNGSFEITQDTFGPTFSFYDDTETIHFILADNIYTTFENGFDRFTANINAGDSKYLALIFSRQ